MKLPRRRQFLNLAAIDLLAGQVQVGFDTMPASIKYIRPGELRALAVYRPCGLFMPPGKCPVCYIGELGTAVSRNAPNLGPRVTIVDNTGKRNFPTRRAWPGPRSNRVLGAAWACGGQPRRPLCRRGDRPADGLKSSIQVL